ncbi:alpha/beta hydrolase [Paenibacillus cymbidii]|uniref:alpha/beta hydrolase n=1 Tax=Paenibacillus cymbidii TaxID=1639034 RepID=UPI0010821656|nr:alpha/beta hydrolase [Paenibacillus cymbidii]
MSYQEFAWTCADGTSQFACEWKPDSRGEVKAAVGIVHGMGEHAGGYAHVGRMFAEAGYAAIAYDQRGHGRTAGKRGHTPDYEALLDGVDRLLAEMAARHPGKPRLLYAHSMGGNVALTYAIRRQPELAGIVVSGPWLRLAFEPPMLTVAIGRIMELIVPSWSNARPGRVDHLTSDPAMAQAIQTDSLRHGVITARFFFSVQRAARQTMADAAKLRVPTLIMHAAEDKVTSDQASRTFAQRAGERCEFVSWEGFGHELHNEVRRSDVFAYVLDWMEKQLNG